MAALSPRERVAALDLLGLSPGPTPDEVTQAYRRLARTSHPDVTGRTDPAAGDRFAAISDAYHRLLADLAEQRVSVQRRATRPPGPLRPFDRTPPPIVAGPVIVTPYRWTGF